MNLPRASFMTIIINLAPSIKIQNLKVFYLSKNMNSKFLIHQILGLKSILKSRYQTLKKPTSDRAIHS